MTLPRYPEHADPAGTGGPPPALIAAFWLGIASVVVGFGSLAVSFFMVSDAELHTLTHSVGERGQQLTLEQARSIYRASALGVALIFLAIAAIWVLFLFYMRNGRNWARIVVSIIAVVWVVVTAPALLSGNAVGVLLGGFQLLVLVGTVGFAFVRSSQSYFDAFRVARRGGASHAQ